MLIVVDTNVLWQSLKGKGSVSRRILELIISQQLEIALSEAIFLEYEDVLKRPYSLSQFQLSVPQVDTILDVVAAVGNWHKIYYRLRPNLKDEGDNMLVELAVTAGAEYLVTNNIKDFTVRSDLKFDDLKVITPIQFIHIWRRFYE